KLIAKLTQFFKTVQTNIEKANERLKSSQIKDADIKHLLDRSENAKTKVDAALNTTTQVFNDAKNMLETLEDFDNVLHSNKERASKAQILSSETESNIVDAEHLNDKLELYFEKINSDLSDTKSLLQLTNTSIQSSNNDLLGLNKTSDLNARAISLAGFTNDLAAGNEDNYEAIAQASSKYIQLDDKLSKVQQKAESIVDRSQNLLNRITNSEHLLDSFKNSDFSLEELSLEAVGRLDAKFEEMVKRIDALDQLDDQIMALEHRYKINNDKIDTYRREIVPLEQNVMDLERILKTMCS
ncbi:hypothetical protein BpHYR1_004198, partial [Brachionus plicatilis]